MNETNNMKNWPKSGYLGPWLSVNMVLGGFFMVDRKDSLSVGGFDKSFTGYGFTEQSLPAKLVSYYSTCLIPLVEHFAIHLNNESNSTQTKEEKYQIFKQRHDYFFNTYLQKTLSEVLTI